MTDYPLIKELRLEIKTFNIYPGRYVDADYLEKLLASAPRVYGPSSSKPDYANWNIKSGICDTHTALLIGIKPINNSVSKSEIKKVIHQIETKYGSGRGCLIDLLSKILEHGVKDE